MYLGGGLNKVKKMGIDYIKMLEYTDENDYDNDVINKSMDNTVVLKFSANWCGPCKKVQPTFQKIIDSYENVTFYHVDIDEHEDLVERESVKSIPFFVVYDNGIKVNSAVAGTSEKLEEFVTETFSRIGEHGNQLEETSW